MLGWGCCGIKDVELRLDGRNAVKIDDKGRNTHETGTRGHLGGNKQKGFTWMII